ncbi:hypothetical protein IFM89_005619 [Coptis chinensis]|uniref:Uncharacterized protein n=1 Tax=Coptis chinensis TaxID=261450 RepID=A0A835HU05_9MAGN|nr:hypothetical protein IFM89_005619 [Coptis chinensis]
MVCSVHQMETAFKSLKDKKEENNDIISVENVMSALQAVPDIDEDLLLDACDFLEDEKKAKISLALRCQTKEEMVDEEAPFCSVREYLISNNSAGKQCILLQAHPDARQYRIRPVPYFDDLCVIFGGITNGAKDDYISHRTTHKDDIHVMRNGRPTIF